MIFLFMKAKQKCNKKAGMSKEPNVLTSIQPKSVPDNKDAKVITSPKAHIASAKAKRL